MLASDTERVLVKTPMGAHVPLGQLANITQTTGARDDPRRERAAAGTSSGLASIDLQQCGRLYQAASKSCGAR
ncbi:MAG: hypothetical protein ACREWE_14070 [Gammaproteobacteria bacterium]